MFQELQLAHCRNMRRRNLVHVPTTEVPDIPFIPNVTGKACAPVVSITLMKCLELPENFALLCSLLHQFEPHSGPTHQKKGRYGN
jgi:hypothetical protein